MPPLADSSPAWGAKPKPFISSKAIEKPSSYGQFARVVPESDFPRLYPVFLAFASASPPIPPPQNFALQSASKGRGFGGPGNSPPARPTPPAPCRARAPRRAGWREVVAEERAGERALYAEAIRPLLQVPGAHAPESREGVQKSVTPDRSS